MLNLPGTDSATEQSSMTTFVTCIGQHHLLKIYVKMCQSIETVAYQVVSIANKQTCRQNGSTCTGLEPTRIPHEALTRAPDKAHIIIPQMSISCLNPMFELLLESSHRDDSNKMSNIGLGQEITELVE